MKQTIFPDERGRVFLLSHLKQLGWKPGEGVEVDFGKVVEKRTSGSKNHE